MFEFELRRVPYKKLRGAIAEHGWNQIQFGMAMNWGESTVSDHLWAKRSWTREDIYNACDALEIPYEEICRYWPKDVYA